MKLLKRNRQAFTIIELIVVIVIIAILVLLALPRFLGYVEKAHLSRIQNDVKAAENVVGAELVHSESLDKWGKPVDVNLKELKNEKKLYSTKGLLAGKDEIEDGPYWKIDQSEFKSKLKGNFYANQGGKVYYEDTKSIKITDEDFNDGNLDDSGKEPEKDPLNKDDLINKKEEAEKLNPDDYEDFTKVEEAIKNADKVIKDENATQKEVDDAKKDLEDAMNDLISKQESNIKSLGINKIVNSHVLDNNFNYQSTITGFTTNTANSVNKNNIQLFDNNGNVINFTIVLDSKYVVQLKSTTKPMMAKIDGKEIILEDNKIIELLDIKLNSQSINKDTKLSKSYKNDLNFDIHIKGFDKYAVENNFVTYSEPTAFLTFIGTEGKRTNEYKQKTINNDAPNIKFGISSDNINNYLDEYRTHINFAFMYHRYIYENVEVAYSINISNLIEIN